jgi:DNA-binding XRE family transcriptional regulator
LLSPIINIIIKRQNTSYKTKLFRKSLLKLLLTAKYFRYLQIFEIYLYLCKKRQYFAFLMEDFIAIANRIKERREQLSYTQADLAEITGISQRTIRSIEKGEGSTSIFYWYKILDALGLEMKIQFKPISDETRKGFIQ